MDETKTVVTERASMTTDAQTNRVQVVLMTPLRIVLVRALRVYLQTLTGLLTAVETGIAASVGVTLPAGDFFHVLAACASIAVAPAIMSVLLNSVELLTKLDSSNPTLRA